MRWLGVIGLYLAGSLLFLWPLPLHLNDQIWGDRFDAWTTLWLIGHLGNGLREGTLSAVTTDILFPFGYNLWSFGHAALQFLGALGVAAGLPLVATYNGLLIGGVASSGLAAHLLGKELSGSHYGGLICGILFCTTPYLYGEGAAGCIELVAAGLLPLHAWALLRLARKPGPGRWAVATGILACIGPFNWYYTLFAGMFGVGFSLWMWKEAGAKVAGWLVLSLMVAGLLDAPLIPLVRRETPSRPGIPPSLYTEEANWEASNALADAQIPVAQLTPELLEQHDAMQVLRNSTQIRTLVGSDFHVNPLKSTPGKLLWVVGLVGAAVAGRRSLGWVILAGGATILTLGPFLTFDDNPPLPEWAGTLPLPYWWAYTYLPFFSKAYRPYRIGILTMMSLSAAAAAAVARWPQHRAWIPILGLLGIYAFSQPLFAGDQPAWRPLADASVPALYKNLAELPRGGVIEVPLQYQPLTVGNARFQYYQLAHRQPLLNCNQLIRRPDLLAFRDYVSGNRFLSTLLDIARKAPPFQVLPEDLQKLHTDGFRYVVAHTAVPYDAVALAGPMGEADLLGQPAMDLLKKLLGEPILKDGEGEVYAIPAQPPAQLPVIRAQDYVEIQTPYDGRLRLVLQEGQHLVLYDGEPGIRRISFWVQATSGREVQLRDGQGRTAIPLQAEWWRRVEAEVAGGPVVLEATERVELSLQRVQGSADPLVPTSP